MIKPLQRAIMLPLLFVESSNCWSLVDNTGQKMCQSAEGMRHAFALMLGKCHVQSNPPTLQVDHFLGRVPEWGSLQR